MTIDFFSTFFSFVFFFFFQAEDGIRDRLVTGVQTCALPIYFMGINVNKKNKIPRNIQRWMIGKKAHHSKGVDESINEMPNFDRGTSGDRKSVV